MAARPEGPDGPQGSRSQASASTAAAPAHGAAAAAATAAPSVQPPYAVRTARAGGRTYHVAAVRFANGDFVSVSEGDPPPAAGIGSMAVSITTPGLPPATTTVIPSKHDGLFLRLAAERISHLNAGISVVTCSARGPLGADGARAVMEAASEMVRRSA